MASRRRWERAIVLSILLFVSRELHETWSFSIGPGSLRRSWVSGGLLSGLAAVTPAAAEEAPPLGSIPKDLKASAVGEKVTTPNGVVYEPLELGTEEGGPRNGPPRGGATVVLRYTAHLDSFDGPIFDSSKLRGSRKPNKIDTIESRLNVDPSLPNCIFEAVKLMKVGAKGQAVCPPKTSYSEGNLALLLKGILQFGPYHI